MRIAACLLVVILAVLPGCGGDDDGGVTTIRVLTWKPDFPAAWDEALDRFHDAHPDIGVEIETGPNDSTQLHDLLAQRLRGRDASLDAFLVDVVWAAEFAAAGWTLPLDDRVTDDDRAAFFPGVLEANTRDGKLHGLGFNTDGGLLYYRRDLLEKHGVPVPETWDDLVRAAQTIVAAEGDDALHGYAGQMKQYEGLVCNLLEIVASHGGDLLHPDTPEAVDAVRFVRDRIVGHVAPRGILTWAEQESLDLFSAGGAVFLRSWPYAWARCQASDAVAGEVGIAPLPHFSGGRSVAALGGWSFGISSFSERKDAAWTFVSFMTSEPIQRLFAVEAGKAPARRALYEDPDVLAANPHFADLRTVFEGATPRPKSPVYPRISNILQRAFHRAISDPRSDAEALMREAASEIERARAAVR